MDLHTYTLLLTTLAGLMTLIDGGIALWNVAHEVRGGLGDLLGALLCAGITVGMTLALDRPW